MCLKETLAMGIFTSGTPEITETGSNYDYEASLENLIFSECAHTISASWENFYEPFVT